MKMIRRGSNKSFTDGQIYGLIPAQDGTYLVTGDCGELLYVHLCNCHWEFVQ